MFCTLAKYQKWIFQARWVQSNIKTSIYHQYLISVKNPHELRWILITIPAHTENLCEVKKKRSLRGTSNSHNPRLTRTSAQSEASLKVRGDASTYINHERSHHKKNSNAHKRHSASVCKQFFPVFSHKGIHQIFLLGFLFLFFMIHLFRLHVCWRLLSKSWSILSARLFLSQSLWVCSVLKPLSVMFNSVTVLAKQAKSKFQYFL